VRLVTGAYNDGDTLKAWLEEHCPEVNYKTAMRFKTLAEGVQRSCNVPAKVTLSLAMPNHDGTFNIPDESPIPFQEAQEAAAGGVGAGRGQERPPVAVRLRGRRGRAEGRRPAQRQEADRREKHEEMVKAANAVWNTNVDALVDNVKRLESHLLLTGATVGKLLTKLGIVDRRPERGGIKAGIGRLTLRNALTVSNYDALAVVDDRPSACTRAGWNRCCGTSTRPLN
jgi:hypothetical protein